MSSSLDSTLHQQHPAVKLPHLVFEEVFAFTPNRDTMGGTAYLIVENSAAIPDNILVDCPAWNETNQIFLQQQGGVRWLFLTHRSAIAQVRELQQAFGCEIVIQEQEAYLLPGLTVTSFQQQATLGSSRAIWTPGHSPGSACLYSDRHGGILFTGRHLLPSAQGEPVPLRIAKTFHWRRQIQSVQRLLDQLTPETLQFICPGANTGFLRGERAIDQAYQRLSQLNLDACLQFKPVL
jgi:glyoxylase-like metal-dependent hydrolase (beta-lactamase superfamily II)